MRSINTDSFLTASVKLIKSRTEMLFVYSWTAVIGTIIASRGFPSMVPTLKVIFVSLFLTTAVYLYNDVIDRDMDASSKNERKKERVIATGEVSVRNALILIVLCSIIGLSISYSVNIITFMTSLLFWIVFMLYSFPRVRFKRMFIIKSAITSTGPSFTMLIGACSVLNAYNSVILFAAIIQAAFMFFVLPALSDSFDIEEDSKFGIKTLAMVLNWKQKIKMMMFAPILVMILTLTLFSFLGFNVLLPVLICLSSILLFKEMRKISEEFNGSKARKVRSYSYVYFTVMPIFMAIGTLSLDMLLPI